FQAENGIRDRNMTGVQTCALPISIYLHIVETRARSERSTGDFAELLRTSLDLSALAERFDHLDPYLTTLERVRGRLLGLLDEARSEERRVGRVGGARRVGGLGG